jgi:hypothetical protein
VCIHNIGATMDHEFLKKKLNISDCDFERNNHVFNIVIFIGCALRPAHVLNRIVSMCCAVAVVAVLCLFAVTSVPSESIGIARELD